jgi:hypothetical protein
VGRLGLGAVAQHGPDVGPVEQVAPDARHVLDAGHLPAPLDAEAHVGPSVGQRERPGVAGEQVGLEPHDQVGRPGAHAGEVLAEGVPLAPVAGGGQAEVLAHRRPHAVGRHRVGRLDVAVAVHAHHHPVPVLGGPGAALALQDGDALGPGPVHQGGVELGAAGDGRVAAAAAGEREGDLVAGRSPHHHVVHRLPRGHGRGVETEALQQAQRPGGEAVAADLVPREAGLVHHHDLAPGARQGDGRRGPGRAGADDDRVGAGQQNWPSPGR